MPQTVMVEGGQEDEWIDASSLRRGEAGIVVDTGRTVSFRVGDVLIRAGHYEVALPGHDGWDSLEVLGQRGLRVRRLRPGERIIIEGT